MNATRVMIGGGLALVLAACQEPMPKVATTLGEYCAMQPCGCFADDRPFWLLPKTADIIWQRDGNASCPEGYILRATDKKP